MSATVSSIASAEATLVASLNATADALDQIGCSDLASALARVQASAEAAKSRMSSAVAELHAQLAGVLAHVEGLAAGVAEVASPAPVQAGQQEAPPCSTCGSPEAGIIGTPAGPVCETCDANAHPDDVCDLTIDPAMLAGGLAATSGRMAIAVHTEPVAASGAYQTADGPPEPASASTGQPERNGRPRKNRR